MAQPDELERLSRLMDGELSEEDARAIESELLRRPDLTEARHRLETLLSVSASLPDGLEQDHESQLIKAVLPRARSWWGWWLVGATAAIAIVVFVLTSVRVSTPPGASVRIDGADGIVTVNGQPVHGDFVTSPGCLVETSSESTVHVVLSGVELMMAPNTRVTVPLDRADAVLMLEEGVAEITSADAVNVKTGDSIVETDGVLLAIVEPPETLARVTGGLEHLAPAETRGAPMQSVFKNLHLPAVTLSAVAVAAVVSLEGHATATPPGGPPQRVAAGETWQSAQTSSPAATVAPEPDVGALVAQVHALQTDKATSEQKLAQLTEKVSQLEARVDRTPVAAGYVRGPTPVTAYFDVKRVIQEADDASDKRRTLEREVNEKQKQLDQMKADLQATQKDYEAKKSALSPGAQREQEAKIQESAIKAQNTYMQLQQDLAKREQEALGDLLQKLEPVVQDLAQADGYTYVFEKNEAGLFYAPAAHDLTSELIRRYNQRYPGKGKTKPQP